MGTRLPLKIGEADIEVIAFFGFNLVDHRQFATTDQGCNSMPSALPMSWRQRSQGCGLAPAAAAELGQLRRDGDDLAVQRGDFGGRAST